MCNKWESDQLKLMSSKRATLVAEESGWADDDIDVEVDENATDICNDERGPSQNI